MASRLFPLDALRAVAAQLIVLHHLCVYGPLAAAMHTAFPLLAGWAYDYGRMAVQVFLVLGGYLSARLLAAQEAQLTHAAPALLVQRYWRLVPPFMAAVGLTLGASWLVAPLLPDLVPTDIAWPQVIAHALLLQDLLGVASLTVGAWYVAIDFQLFALLLAVMWALRRLPLRRATRQWLAPAVVGALCAASLLHFNRVAALDACALYFFGAYGLGALLWWSEQWPAGWRHVAWGTLGAVIGAALVVQFRERLVVAAATAVVIAVWRQRGVPAGWAAAVPGLARHAYALFLVHFPVCLLVNALYEHRVEQPAAWPAGVGELLPAAMPEALGDGGALLALLALVLAWGLSNMAAVPFHRWIEAPLLRWRPRAAALPQGAAMR